MEDFEKKWSFRVTRDMTGMVSGAAFKGDVNPNLVDLSKLKYAVDMFGE